MLRAMQVPENYFPLVIKYLVGIRGGAREAGTQEFVILDDSEFICRN